MENNANLIEISIRSFFYILTYKIFLCFGFLCSRFLNVQKTIFRSRKSIDNDLFASWLAYLKKGARNEYIYSATFKSGNKCNKQSKNQLHISWYFCVESNSSAFFNRKSAPSIDMAKLFCWYRLQFVWNSNINSMPESIPLEICTFIQHITLLIVKTMTCHSNNI